MAYEYDNSVFLSYEQKNCQPPRKAANPNNFNMVAFSSCLVLPLFSYKQVYDINIIPADKKMES